jgi:hypothetical protein
MSSGISPQIIEGYTFVPLRAIADGLGNKPRKKTWNFNPNLLYYTIDLYEMSISTILPVSLIK